VHRLKVMLAAAVVGLVPLAVAPGEARAGKAAEASCGWDGCDSQASNGADGPAVRGRRRATQPSSCRYVTLDVPPDTPLFRSDGTQIPTDAPGRWLEKRCFESTETDFYGERMFTQGSFTGSAVFVPARTPADLRDEAFGHLALPSPTAAMSPAGDQYVQFPTWLWVNDDWTARSSTVSVPGVTVVVTATPERTVFDTGDGAMVVCVGPGRPYDPSVPDEAQHTDCFHTYTRTGDYRVTARVDWHVTWSVDGAPGGGDLGVVSRSTPPMTVRVAEIQALNIRPRR